MRPWLATSAAGQLTSLLRVPLQAHGLEALDRLAHQPGVTGREEVDQRDVVGVVGCGASSTRRSAQRNASSKSPRAIAVKDRAPPAQARRGWTELEVRFATRDVQRAFVGSQVRPPGECAAPAWSLHRRASCGRPTSPAQCASSAESPVGRTPPALERLRVSPRAFRDRALESSSSLVKCSCFKIRCILCRLQAGAGSRSYLRIEERELEAGGLN